MFDLIRKLLLWPAVVASLAAEDHRRPIPLVLTYMVVGRRAYEEIRRVTVDRRARTLATTQREDDAESSGIEAAAGGYGF